MQELIEESKPNRMQKLWSLMAPKIPAASVFWRGKTLETQGFRWAPKSLTSHVGHFIKPGPPFGSLQDRGLLVQYPGLVLGSTTDFSIANSFGVIDEHAHLFKVILRSRDAPASACAELGSYQINPWQSIKSGSILGRMALVIDRDFGEINQQGEFPKGHVLLVLQEQLERGTWYVRSVCGGHIFRVPLMGALLKEAQGLSEAQEEPIDMILSILATLGPRTEDITGAVRIMHGTRCDKHHKWCVDCRFSG